jgi:hypothetical protein
MNMARQSTNPAQLTPHDKTELDAFNEAARKQKAAASIKEKALAGHKPPPDPNAPPPPPDPNVPPGPMTPSEINLSQQAEIEASDTLRKAEMERHMSAVRAGRNPHAVGSTIDLLHSAASSVPAPGVVATAAATGMFEIWRAIRQDGGEERKMVDATLVYADSWTALRSALKSQDDGDWLAIRYQFPANVANVLGFFIELRSSYAEPKDSVVEKFDVIVKGPKIFRSEIEPEPAPEPEPAEET